MQNIFNTWPTFIVSIQAIYQYGEQNRKTWKEAVNTYSSYQQKKNKSESKKRVNYITILSSEAFKSRQITEIHVMVILKTIDQIEIKIKIPKPSH